MAYNYFKSENDEYDDDTPMPYGKHKGVPLGEIPDSYLLWLKENTRIMDKKLERYIDSNMNAIEENLKRKYKRNNEH